MGTFYRTRVQDPSQEIGAGAELLPGHRLHSVKWWVPYSLTQTDASDFHFCTLLQMLVSVLFPSRVFLEEGNRMIGLAPAVLLH